MGQWKDKWTGKWSSQLWGINYWNKLLALIFKDNSWCHPIDAFKPAAQKEATTKEAKQRPIGFWLFPSATTFQGIAPKATWKGAKWSEQNYSIKKYYLFSDEVPIINEEDEDFFGLAAKKQIKRASSEPSLIIEQQRQQRHEQSVDNFGGQQYFERL